MRGAGSRRPDSRAPAAPEAIGYGRQYVDQDDIDAVVEVLRGERLTQGPVIGRFEEALGAWTGAPHAVAVCNGSAALHLAYLALDVGDGVGAIRILNRSGGQCPDIRSGLRFGQQHGTAPFGRI